MSVSRSGSLVSANDALLGNQYREALRELHLDLDEEIPESVKDAISSVEAIDEQALLTLYTKIRSKLLSELKSHPGLDTLQLLQADRAAFFFCLMKQMDRSMISRTGEFDVKLYRELAQLFTRQSEALQKEARSVGYDEAFRRDFITKTFTAIGEVLLDAISDDRLRAKVQERMKIALMRLISL